ncbi:hypothetical protein GGR95_003123 [Sulfitobacter undariae]|uniref:Uncharacterized protein n=1 Tax=Sulfitobacter undariae TaxID=1563671 RepID=A0A7W6E650_9RHOB|nr:hypothetical protein [Sulfitobacter undariae]MBB3995467.1 hypothetical protein [Sulfitobacter undariae]
MDLADFKLEIGNRIGYGFPTVLGCNLAQMSSLQVNITLTDTSEAATIIIQDPDHEKPVFSFERQVGCSTDALREAAKGLHTIVAEHSLVLPSNVRKRAAFEHFQALA